MKKIFLLLAIFVTDVHATDLIDLYDRARQHNFNILNNTIDLNIANESLKQTRSSVYPEVDFRAQASETTIERYESSGSFDPADYDRDTYNLTIRQPLIHLYVFDEIKKAKNSIKQSEISKDNASSILILESVRNYFNLIKYKNLVELNEAKRDLNKSKYNASEKLFRNGSITLEDFQKIRNNFEISQNDVSLSINSLDEIKNEVFIFSGKELNDINDIKLTKINHREYVLDQLLSKAYSRNFMVNMSRENININRNEIASQKSRHYPTIDLVAEYDYLDLTQGGSQFGATTREDSTISIVLNFPIFKGGYQSSKIKQARMNYEKARLEHKNSKRTVRKDIIDNFNRYNLNKKQYHTALQILKTNLKKYENAQLGFDKGIYSDTQVLESKMVYLESLSDAKNIMMDYVYSEMTIKYLLNELDMSSLRKVNTYLVW